MTRAPVVAIAVDLRRLRPGPSDDYANVVLSEEEARHIVAAAQAELTGLRAVRVPEGVVRGQG